MSNWSSLRDLQPIIEQGYVDLGYESDGDYGYRFLSSPESTLGSKQMIMSINPAGGAPDYERDTLFLEEETNLYECGHRMAAPMGSSRLRDQYDALFKFLEWEPRAVLQAPFSPYRGKWRDFKPKRQKVTLEFCRSEIWEPYFSKRCPLQIICVGEPPDGPIRDAFPYQVVETTPVYTGWDNRSGDTATIYRFENDTVMIRIPHLSQFRIMTAQSCGPHLKNIFGPFLN